MVCPRSYLLPSQCKQKHVAKFIVPDWGDKVNYGQGVVVPAHQATWASGLVRQPYAGVNYIPQPGTMNLAIGPGVILVVFTPCFCVHSCLCARYWCLFMIVIPLM
jgi:hypothetical protein